MSTNVTVAQNICGDQTGVIPPNLDCSLCLIGFPQAGGTIGVTFYGPVCPPSATPSLSYWMGPSTKYAPFKCAWECPTTAEPNANQWVAEATFGGASSGSCANQYKMRAILTALNASQISISVTVFVLVFDGTGWAWTSYITWSETLTEIANADTTRYRGRAFGSPNYVGVTPNQVGGMGDPVSYVKTVVGLQSMRLGCGSKAYALPICGFWNGTRWLTCLRGVIRSTADTAIRQFFQLGFDTDGCGSVGGTYCGCDEFTLTATSPPVGTAAQNADAGFITNYGVLGIESPPGTALETVGTVQQIQIGSATASGIQVVVKKLSNNASLWVCTNDNGAGWVCSVPTVAQANSPHILTIARTGFDIYLYALQFPNPNILADECGNGGAYPTPNPETDPWWCTPDGCVQSPLQPANTTGGPYSTFALCSASCAAQTGEYWCWYGYCYQSETQPAGSTGPYATALECAAVCGPTEMVWHCAPDSGCALIARYEAIQLGYTYYGTQAQCLENCTSAWWCTAEGCLQWWGGGSPPGATSGPYASQELCDASCVVGGPGYYCVDGACGYYSSAPVGATAGPYATALLCGPNCFVGFETTKPATTEPDKDRLEFIRKVQRISLTPCRHLGDPVEEAPSCGCSGGLVHACAKKGKCVKSGPSFPKNSLLKHYEDAVTSCWDCPDYEPGK